MIDLYTFTTPNGRKASIMLEEIGLPYRVKVVDIGKGEQRRPEYLEINPNNKIPSIVDEDGPGGEPITVFESGAILIYLAEKTGHLLAAQGPSRSRTIQWVMFQMSGIGPTFGQLNHFSQHAPEKIPYAIERFTAESTRLLHVLDRPLRSAEFVAGAYSIADIALFPWLDSASKSFPKLMSDVPGVQRWLQTVGARPAVQRGMLIPQLG